MSEWRELFNGKNLDGWEDFKNPHLWSVEDGMIVAVSETRKMSNLSTAEQFGDFELALEFNVEPKANSGVFVRVSNLRDEVHTGLEIQILDTSGIDPGLPKHACGGLYDLIAPKVDAARRPGEWNEYRIVCQGPSLTIDLNGQRTVEANLDDFDTPGLSPDGMKNKFKYAWKTMPRVGHIGLQTHPAAGNTSGVRTRFRNIRIR